MTEMGERSGPEGGECGKSEIGEANLPQKSSLFSNQDIERGGGWQQVGGLEGGNE